MPEPTAASRPDDSGQDKQESRRATDAVVLNLPGRAPAEKPAGGRRRFSAKFRAEAVERAAAPGATVAGVARELAISPTTLRRWIQARDSQLPPESEVEPRSQPAADEERPVHERIHEEWPDWRDFDWPVLPQEDVPGSVARQPAEAPQPAPPQRVARPIRPGTRAPTEMGAMVPAEVNTLDTSLSAPPHPGDEIFPALSRLGPGRRIAIIVVALVGAVALSTFVPAAYPLRAVVVALHVLAMVAAFGAVLLIDWHGLLWLAGRRGLTESTRLAAAAGPVIWGGLGGLIVTGALLRPDVGSPLTLTKLVLVLLVATNGAVMSAPRRRLASLPAHVSPVQLSRHDWRQLMIATTLSQVGWWGAVIIGFINSSR